MLNADLFANIKNAFLDWMDDQDNSGGNVADTALATINRAQDNLERYDCWDGLVKDANLTLGGTDGRTANLPSDFSGEVIAVGIDSNNDGKFDTLYYKDSTDISNGYKIRYVFTAATGYAGTIQFMSTVQGTPIIRYKIKLTAFVGSGTEYSFFPFDLLLAEAQYIHVTESGIVGADLQAIEKRRKELLRDFRQERQYKNHDMRSVQNDSLGYPIYNNGYSMTGESTQHRDGYSNDYDRR